MKTTMNLDDALLRRAKRTAADRGITLTALFEQALEAHLARKQPAKQRFRWVVVKDAAPPGVDVADRRSLYDRMEGRA